MHRRKPYGELPTDMGLAGFLFSWTIPHLFMFGAIDQAVLRTGRWRRRERFAPRHGSLGSLAAFGTHDLVLPGRRSFLTRPVLLTCHSLTSKVSFIRGYADVRILHRNKKGRNPLFLFYAGNNDTFCDRSCISPSRSNRTRAASQDTAYVSTTA